MTSAVGVAAHVPLLGRHNASNAAAAACVALALDVGEGSILDGLAEVAPAKHRLQLVQLGGRTILDDCYNAAPASMRAALDALVEIAPAGAQKLAVLGDMLELGPESARLHAEIGAYAAARVDRLIAFGPQSRHMSPARRRRRSAAFTPKVRAGRRRGPPRLRRGRRGAGEGVARHAPRARHRGAGRGGARQRSAGEGAGLMLYHLLYPLHVHAGLHGLNVLRYVSTRIIAATLTALAISFLMGPWFIDRLRSKQIGEQIRTDGPQTHKKKAGTPTMGGSLILFALVDPDALVVRSDQPLRLADAARDHRLRRRRLRRRLSQADAQQEGHQRPLEDGGAAGHRRGRRSSISSTPISTTST